MERITRKETFDCALALYASIIDALNEQKDKLYDYALILQKHSLSPVILLRPGEYFQWNGSDGYGEKTYAFIPILHNYIAESILKHCGGNDNEYYGLSVSFEKFNAFNHPCPWIKDVLAKQYLRLTYIGETLFANDLAYDSSLFSKVHSMWICAKVDDITVYIPYYTSTERSQIFNKIRGNYYADMTQKYWED